ncbi:NAD(P)/FAD-dependent oxidoreductase [Halalkalicoccus jeotgali]|uniref:Flavin-containing amine-oxidoreductase n=1 Tax=Halalkalicoccus jeotgali (strain DSM 18796 / CECT 7217 / JCM 14584 / KCTC 4019 / B3) TaxID=795797 RepID=D8J331_HALJB|nr:FAD-dependent oxidoreductase [Halalkalicoccus jeotgali]ADJ15138.1 flavin-containing amine-oxidoreductase [Halalkalicoccus jeotgali B3]ELY35142.1 flavin-containing amine-oxidoreductase [Halalkalicoccus jeotgali B3]
MEIGIVGAGVAGIGVAYELRESSAAVTVLEKGQVVGGRAATRRKNGCIYDYGANYITPDEDLERLVRERASARPIGIEAPVWTFDADGVVTPGEDRDRPALTYADGIARKGERWRVESEDLVETFDALVLTPPAPQTAALLTDTDWDDPLRDRLVGGIETVSYRTILSIVLHYPFEIDRPYYALVNTDKDHEIGWCSREECKPGHVPDGQALLVVQMAPEWSLERYGEPDERIADAAARLAADLLDEPRIATPDWCDLGRFRHALPDGAPEADVLSTAADRSLHFAGDWVTGEGRVGAAFESGRDLGRRLSQSVDEPR